MKTITIIRINLLFAGLLATVIGTLILVAPVIFYEGYDIDLAGKVDLLNETRASGGGLLVYGLLITFGSFLKPLMFSAAIASTCLYLSYGFSRLISITLDGVPTTGLVQAMILEIIVGLACALCTLTYYRISKQQHRRPVYADQQSPR